MVGLLDIAPKTETIEGVTVLGIGIKGVVTLLQRFPELKAVLIGGKVDGGKIIELAPDAVASIIAVGCGELNSNAEERAAKLPLEIQMDFIEAIMRLTMPSGFGPFVARLERLGVLGNASANAMPVMNSGKPSNTLSQTDIR